MRHLKKSKSVILHFFPVAEIGRKKHLSYFSYPQEIYSQYVEWEKKVLSPYSHQWSVYFPVLLLLITRIHPVLGYGRWTDSEAILTITKLYWNVSFAQKLCLVLCFVSFPIAKLIDIYKCEAGRYDISKYKYEASKLIKISKSTFYLKLSIISKTER